MRRFILKPADTYEGFTETNYEEFFKIVIGKKLDVNPTPHGPWCRQRGYVTVWEFRDYSVFGLSDGGGPGGKPDRYFFKG